MAADKLGLTQPAVSNALNRLRQSVGDPLFIRSRNGMEPTAMALRLADTIHSGLSTIRAGLSASSAFDAERSDRRFTLVMTDVGEISFLPQILSELSRNAPMIDLSVVEFGIENYDDLLDSGVADLAVGRISLSQTLRSELIHTSRYVAILRSDHPMLDHDDHGRPIISYANYLRGRHVSVAPRGATPNPVDKALAHDAAVRRIALKIPHSTVLPSIMNDTDLIATVPDTCVKAIAGHGELCAVELPFEVEENRVYQWWHRRNDDDASHKWLRRLFAAAG